MSCIEVLTDLGAWAVMYADYGTPVLPIEPGGKAPFAPFAPNGLDDATTDAEVVGSWWDRRPDLNVGLRTGVTFDVLDVDDPDVVAVDGILDRAIGDGAELVGPMVLTAKGLHVYCRPTGHGNRTKLLPDVDWKGRRGYVVAPPSIHESGAVYVWSELYPPTTPLMDAPPWLDDLLSRPAHRPAPTPTTSSGTTPYGRRALDAELGRLAMTTEGQRNDTLHVSAIRLGQLYAGGQLDGAEALGALEVVALRTGLGTAEVSRTIESGWTKGVAEPRRPAHG